ncbi:phenylalanine--tRNA ligase subunit beta [Campylobacter jejuni]|uniref:phenylalanine--tRNA ligase subunit beta n=1 Tax=Campylobacter jejuni TaxID=197 RepID=UPI000D56CB7A|nr:phenylalanine--tRNA ligase subunit beta [Campylobacter jejuni]EAL0738404.1 phenylalanine--tRNA ligase subunit beta [Campylobacter jejuni]ECL3162652.1 phenylalanine--tRNA ligase subunit beta [Campylobacter jejuni]EDP5503215.1 phenylalanine--tRNA ligase subunit beta [Campylobacter jejuni]EFT1352364.1 phenylalanine--tRNA ligase subunit beta [Campylobacter jejuni]EIE5552521.1 phenylalanine--tRNA ligase subunit beta [Campylobacter jejuni]
MIITRSWLNDWLELEEISSDKIAKTLNSIGIEVDRVSALKAPDKVVVGYVKEKIKHENSDKLSICQVDIGSETLQIVCGAANVDAGQFVAVATKGAIMPNGMEIKEAKLRGVDSCGMLCSSLELGFEKTNEGIMLLDESIGKLELGRALNTYEIFNDELIEVELTPNRGDCLSIYGIARDLATALNLKEPKPFKEGENVLGIGRILRLAAEKELNGLYNYRAIELKGQFQINLLLSLRLAQIESLGKNSIENLLSYATHSTGVLFNAYDLNSLSGEDEEFTINLTKQAHGETKVSCKDKFLSFSGIFQNDESKCKNDSKIVIIEANYTDPLVIANAKMYHKDQDEKTLYRSFRGSEPKLNLGMDFLLSIFEQIPNLVIYSSSQQILTDKELPIIPISIESIGDIIGQNVDKDEVLKILKKLGFELILSGEGLINVKAPLHRPDIKNLSDICEEVVRIIGIDNIASKGLEFIEKNRLNSAYKNYIEFLNLRKRAVASGYFESLHYVLDNEEELKRLGFDSVKLKLINPITAELNTLRTTLLNHLLNAASLNAKNSKKIIKLFELGAVFNVNNQELNRIAFIHSGLKEEAKISNKAKPESVQFYDFLLDIKNIIGDFKLKSSKYNILSPYEQADIYLSDIKVGFIGRLHLKIENERDLPKTYICELDLDLIRQDFKIAKPYSKFPAITRDLSVLIPKGFEYNQIKNCIEELNLEILENFRLVDIYSDENLKEFYSITISFSFRDINKTLEDNQVNECMDKILNTLKNLGLDLR